VVGDAFFGIAIIADQTILAAQHYQAVGYPFGPSLATSQVLGGGIIWILGDAVGLPFLAVQLIQMMREDKVEAAEIDAELDARDAARAAARAQQAASAGHGPDGVPAGADAAAPADGASPEYDAVNHEADGADDDDRPWWESDPRITNRYNRA
jgi:hypothetical protein